jgi:hypothetical protein
MFGCIHFGNEKMNCRKDVALNGSCESIGFGTALAEANAGQARFELAGRYCRRARQRTLGERSALPLTPTLSPQSRKSALSLLHVIAPRRVP